MTLLTPERQAGVGAQRRGDAEVAGGADDVVAADPLGNLHRDRVARISDRVAQQLGPAIGIAIIARLPVAEPDRPVVDRRRRRQAVAEGGEIDEQFERRARLAAGLDGAVERALRIILAADHGDDAAVEPHRHQRGLGAAEAGAADGADGEALEIALERRLDEPLAIAVVGQLGRLGQHPVGEIGAGRARRRAGRGGRRAGRTAASWRRR